MQNIYLIRLDDACPTMDSERWTYMESLLDKYEIKPMVGIVPDNQDNNLKIEEKDCDFWRKAQKWEKKGWAIALHGYDHRYISEEGWNGINPMWKRSEFAGVPLDKQKEKIHKGVEKCKEHGIKPKYFFAPSHTFDKNTLVALREESDIRIISDTIGRFPYKFKEFYFIPQITGHCVKMPLNGIYTFCFHPNVMDDIAFSKLECFLNMYGKQFIGFDEIELNNFGKKKAFDKLLSSFYFFQRRIRGLR